MLIKEIRGWALDIYELALDDTLLDKLGDLRTQAQQNATAVKILSFTYNVEGYKVRGFLLAPRKVKAPLPCIIFNRGGTQNFGLLTRGQLFTRLATMARWGFVVVGSQYPGNSVSEGKDERGGLLDLQSVWRLRSLLEHLTIADANRIGMYGESRGGMMTYLSLAQVDWIKAAVTVGAPTNLPRELKLRPEMKQIYKDAFGGSVAAQQARSALFWPEKLPNIPLLMLHGTADTRVTADDSIELAAALKKLGKPHKLQLFEDADHGLHSKKELYQTMVRDWFKRHL